MQFNAGERVRRVRITSGNTALVNGPNETAAIDVVAMDDFIYAEPASIPEPGTWLLLAGGAILVLIGRRHSTRLPH